MGSPRLVVARGGEMPIEEVVKWLRSENDRLMELADRLLGEGWQQRFIDQARSGGIEKVLL